MKLFSLLSIVLISWLLTACSNVCKDAGIKGRYELESKDRLYSLELDERGIGRLSVNGKAVGDLRWALLDEDARLELDASGSAYKTLRQAGAFDAPPPDAIKVHRGAFTLPAECSWQGKLVRLAMNIDRGIYFRRARAK